uniref:Uncharacterized protein n=1 Tax=Parascaris equorum TaxID=6256 RepID=A0A914S2G4_PAREQ
MRKPLWMVVKFSKISSTHTILALVYPDNRIFINAEHQLIIKYLTMDDDNTFYRFGAFVLILIMVLSVVLNTSVQSEIYRRAASIQKFQQTQRNR